MSTHIHPVPDGNYAHFMKDRPDEACGGFVTNGRCNVCGLRMLARRKAPAKREKVVSSTDKTYKSVKTATFNGVLLRLAFDPQAIRGHFPENPEIARMADEDLLEIGREALEDDELAEAFHSVLVRAVCKLHPDVDEIELE